MINIIIMQQISGSLYWKVLHNFSKELQDSQIIHVVLVED